MQKFVLRIAGPLQGVKSWLHLVWVKAFPVKAQTQLSANPIA